MNTEKAAQLEPLANDPTADAKTQVAQITASLKSITEQLNRVVIIHAPESEHRPTLNDPASMSRGRLYGLIKNGIRQVKDLCTAEGSSEIVDVWSLLCDAEEKIKQIDKNTPIE